MLLTQVTWTGLICSITDKHIVDDGAETSPSPRIAAQEGLLVRCILIRAAYGGMAGDVAMLKAFASTWNRRSAAVMFTTCAGMLFYIIRQAGPDTACILKGDAYCC